MSITTRSMSINTVLIALVAVLSPLSRAEHPPVTPCSLSFETDAERGAVKFGDARGTADRQYAIDGEYALKVELLKGAHPAVTMTLSQPWDLSSYRALAVDIANPGDRSIRLSIHVANEAGEATAEGCDGFVILATKSKTQVTLDFDSKMPALHGVQGRVYEKGPTVHARYDGKGGFKRDRIGEITIGIEAWADPATIVIDNVRPVATGEAITPAAEPVGIVDQFGQFAWDDWPGKLHAEPELAGRLSGESKDLDVHPAFNDRDRFGGWATGPLLSHTGYFTTGKNDAKWSLVDPDGHLFLSFGLDCVGTSLASPLDGREPLYAWLPATGDPLASAVTKSIRNGQEMHTVDFLRANLLRKFGTDWLPNWRAEAERRLPSWGFNTIGNWSHDGFYGNAKVPYTVVVYTSGTHNMLGHVGDPWDPRFASDLDANVLTKAESVKGDPWCIGYFVDNEIWWRWIATTALEQDAAKSPAKREFISELQAKYSTVDALNAAWGTTLASWDALGGPFKAPKQSTNGLQADLAAFRYAHALKYFTVVRDALKAHDSDHLYLGCRFAESTPEAVKACAEVCDVVSYNVYQGRVLASDWDKWLKGIDKPALIGEFHFGALDRGLFRVGMQGASNQKQRAQFFEQYVADVIKNPHFVGCHWFSYYDEPLLGRPGDGENFNIGFVDVTDTPYPEMVAASRRALADPYVERWGGAGR